jgi:cytidine deaminase
MARTSVKPSKALVKAVKGAVRFAYAPYSKVQVAAGLYCGNDRIYTGVNIENSSFSLTVCAERVAFFKAVCAGERKFLLMLLYSPQIDFITPCGACLQVINEFSPDLLVATMDSSEKFKFYPLTTLLGHPFRL